MIPEIPQYYKSQGDPFEEQFNEDTRLVMEVMEINLTPGTTIFHKKANETPYILLKNKNLKSLMVGGIRSVNSGIKEQSNEIFQKLEDILEREKMSILKQT